MGDPRTPVHPVPTPAADRGAMPAGSWVVVSNTPITSLNGLAASFRLGGLHVYHRNATGLDGPALGLDLDVRSMTAAPADDLLYSAPSPRPTFIRLEEDAATVVTSMLNEDQVYYAAERVTGRFAYFTDLFLSALVLPALGLSVDLGPVPRRTAGNETLVPGVERLGYGLVHESRHTRRGWITREVRSADLLGRYHRPTRHNPFAAGRHQLEALAAAVDGSLGDSASCATLLSGGIDSGTVTMLAARRGRAVTAYSVGTPWGDEFADAAQLCRHVGAELRPLRFKEDDFVLSLPDAVRWLGVVSAETVEVALTMVTVQRLRAVPEDLPLLTGYGSDLINAGVHGVDATDAEITAGVLRSVHGTRFSNELNGRAELAYRRKVHHPFWHWPVMKAALETAASCKVRDGREKYHLRTAMQEHVPYEVAWRRKIAVHHGGGLQGGLARRITRDIGERPREALYFELFRALMDETGRGLLDRLDPVRIHDAALKALSENRH
ncbi:asparagine synthase-related protein [Streptomyces exfoliatus]|uniref:asparagine synthase-related protein n=1 Tax=Streptomyces exfoliatus TaxID=1905 RepID=UPI0004665776|nr:asparagine synthase-related protein [Streptomyces exfoliatus]